MASCEKCWAAAGGDPDRYKALLDQAFLTGKKCTPEDQAGPDAGTCPTCKRKTVHQYACICTICGWRPEPMREANP